MLSQTGSLTFHREAPRLSDEFKAKLLNTIKLELNSLERSFTEILARRAAEEDVTKVRNLIAMYVCALKNPEYLFDHLKNPSVITFLDKHPDYILRILNNSAISANKLLKSFKEPQPQGDLLPWEKNRIDFITNSKIYKNDAKKNLQKPWPDLDTVFRVLNKLFNNIAFTIGADKYRNNRLLNDLQKHLCEVISPENRTTIIENLLLSHTNTDLAIVNIIDRFNIIRSPQESLRKPRLNVPTEVLIRLALETGFQLTHEHFYVEPTDIHRYQEKLEQQYQEDSERIADLHRRMFSPNGPYQQALTDPNPEKQKFCHLFNPTDHDLNQFSAQFIIDLKKAIDAHNTDKCKTDKNRFAPCNSANFSFVRFSVGAANFIAIAVSVSATEHPANIEVISQFVASYEKEHKYSLGCQLIFIDPEHHAAKSVIPHLASYLKMDSNAAKSIYESRRSQRDKIFIDGFIDHFKGCAEIFYTGFFAQLLRLYPELVFRSLNNLALGEPNQKFKPFCQNCCMKRRDYKLELQLARLLGDNNLLLDPDNEVDFGKIEHSHSEAPAVQRVRKTVAPVLVDEADTPLKGQPIKRHRSKALLPGTQFYENSPMHAGARESQRDEGHKKVSKFKLTSESNE